MGAETTFHGIVQACLDPVLFTACMLKNYFFVRYWSDVYKITTRTGKAVFPPPPSTVCCPHLPVDQDHPRPPAMSRECHTATCRRRREVRSDTDADAAPRRLALPCRQPCCHCCALRRCRQLQRTSRSFATPITYNPATPWRRRLPAATAPRSRPAAAPMGVPTPPVCRRHPARASRASRAHAGRGACTCRRQAGGTASAVGTESAGPLSLRSPRPALHARVEGRCCAKPAWEQGGQEKSVRAGLESRTCLVAPKEKWSLHHNTTFSGGSVPLERRASAPAPGLTKEEKGGGFRPTPKCRSRN